MKKLVSLILAVAMLLSLTAFAHAEDVITLDVLTIDKGYYDFLMSLQMNSLSIPLFSPQPADAPTNLQGEKVVGYFATCPLSTASVTIEDPQRSYYKKLFPFR